MHTADQQPGKGLANIPGDAGGALRDRHIETVRAVGRLATERGVNAVLVAGDAFVFQHTGKRFKPNLLY